MLVCDCHPPTSKDCKKWEYNQSTCHQREQGQGNKVMEKWKDLEHCYRWLEVFTQEEWEWGLGRQDMWWCVGSSVHLVVVLLPKKIFCMCWHALRCSVQIISLQHKGGDEKWHSIISEHLALHSRCYSAPRIEPDLSVW